MSSKFADALANPFSKKKQIEILRHRFDSNHIYSSISELWGEESDDLDARRVWFRINNEANEENIAQLFSKSGFFDQDVCDILVSGPDGINKALIYLLKGETPKKSMWSVRLVRS